MYHGHMATELERVTVNLVPRASAALELATGLSQDSKTDTINRALQVYAFLLQAKEAGGGVYVREGPKAELMQVSFL